jgi:hypothetical protein
MPPKGSAAPRAGIERWLAACLAAVLGCASDSNGPGSTEEAIREAAREVPGVADLVVMRDTDDSVLTTGTLDGTSFAARFPRPWNKRAVQWAHGYQLPAPGAVEKPAQHCDFTPAQWRAAWTQLRAWVEDGVRPPNGVEVPAAAP